MEVPQHDVEKALAVQDDVCKFGKRNQIFLTLAGGNQGCGIYTCSRERALPVYVTNFFPNRKICLR